MPANAFEIATFRANNPDVVAYLENHPTDVWAPTLENEGVLSDPSTAAIRNVIEAEAENAPELPAEEWHAAWIPNGDYSVVTEVDRPGFATNHEFRVHLVTRGPLAGKRIVKVKRPGSNLYSGFGFLTRGGRFQLWTRFAAHTNEAYVAGARALFEALGLYGPASSAADVVTDFGTGRAIRENVTTSRGPLAFSYQVRAVRCLHCNNIARTWLRPFPLCIDHSRIPERPVEYRTVEAQPPRRRAPRTPRSAPTSSRAPLMSEVSGKWVR